jgi:hypothetical protein
MFDDCFSLSVLVFDDCFSLSVPWLDFLNVVIDLLAFKNDLIVCVFMSTWR